MTRRALLRRLGAVALTSAWLCFAARGQTQESALSDAEVEKLRDTAYFPADRLLAFVQFLDDRARAIDKLMAGKRQPGREEDVHDMMEQWTSVANDLIDNLDDYGKRHRDVRKALPKLMAAAERWGTALKSPPEDKGYSVARKLALETLNDIQTEAKQMIEEQKVYFKDHPPAKDDRPQKPG